MGGTDMDKKAVVASTVKYVRSSMSDEGNGHDWWHTYRVWKTALEIAKLEKGADLFLVQLGALLHDVADWKFNGGDDKAGERATRAWLGKLGVDDDTIGQVCQIVNNVSFKGSGVKDAMRTLEGKIVQDADRLDAIGAIGIARAFMYGGYEGSQMHDPDSKPKSHKSFAEYKASNATVINHFYEKLLLLKGRMNTPTARKMANDRDAFMRLYLGKFYKEWNGKE
jgi:uncharacterized protein